MGLFVFYCFYSEGGFVRFLVFSSFAGNFMPDVSHTTPAPSNDDVSLRPAN